MWAKRIMWIAWPAFLMAGIMELLVFAIIDPNNLYWFGGSLQLSREGMYTLAFFVFWGIIMFSSALTTILSLSSSEVNKKNFSESNSK